MTFKESGDSYDGAWANDKMNGQGKYTWKDGSFYEGDFSNDIIEGEGKITYTISGAWYEGSWEKNMKQG